jgi:uncharacterized protein YycO
MIALQFSSDGTLGDKVIRHYTWSDYGHVDLVLSDGMLLGARPPDGVQIRPPDYTTFITRAVYGCSFATPEQENWIIAFCKGKLGAPYNYEADAGIRLHQDWSTPGAWMCSQLLGAAFASAGVPLLNQPLYNRITPEQLRESPLLRLQ